MGKASGHRRVTVPGDSWLVDMKQALDIAGEDGIYKLPSLGWLDMQLNSDYREPPVVNDWNLPTSNEVL